jgi:beclin
VKHKHGASKSNSDNPAMSFVMLSESQVQLADGKKDGGSNQSSPQKVVKPKIEEDDEKPGKNALPLSHRTETAARLFEILSARSDIDNPICVECTELLIETLQKRVASATRERDAYVDFLRTANADIPSEEEVHQAQLSLDTLKDKEQKALSDLERLEAEKAALTKELMALEEELQGLNTVEEDFWRERNAFTTQFGTFQSEKEAVTTKYDRESQQLERLQRANVFNDTFSIGYDGIFGTINGLRLGRLSQPQIEWAEINAALGQACLLLATVADKLGFSFQNYRLNPMGSNSTIEKLEYPQSSTTNDPAHQAKPKITILELHCAGDLPLGLGFLHRRFDSAMVAFLDCVRQLGDYIERGYSGGSGHSLKLPYRIQKDKINDVSIKLGFNQEESWTKACKYTLTCLKYLLAHASNIHSTPRLTS